MSDTNNKEYIERVIRDFKEYATMRQKDVVKGLESPILAALIVQKYGYGLIKALQIYCEIAGSPNLIANIMEIIDAEVNKIDPEWQLHQSERWSSYADIVYHPKKHNS